MTYFSTRLQTWETGFSTGETLVEECSLFVDFSFWPDFLSYPDVHVTDSTKYNVWGTVKYAACSNDDYSLTPDTTWSHDRGLCLITEITATVRTPAGDFKAKSYTSSGTSYSKFAVVVNAPGGNNFIVTRIVN